MFGRIAVHSTHWSLWEETMNLGKVAPLIVVLCLLATTAGAGIVQSSDYATIHKDEVVSDNLIALGQSTSMAGILEGDLVSAGRNVDVSGLVRDNIYAAAQDIHISGYVGGDGLLFAQMITIEDTVASDIRGGCQLFELRGVITNDLMMGAQRVTIARDATVGGDVYVGAKDVDIEGTVEGKVFVGVETLTIAGTVMGDVEVWADNIRFVKDGKIVGDLVFHADHTPDPEWASYVNGKIIHEPMDWEAKTGTKHDKWNCNKWPNRVFSLLAALATAIFLIGFFKPLLLKGFDAFTKRPWVRGGVGLLGIIVMPVGAVLAMVLVLTLPVGLITIGLYPMFLYISWVLFAIIGGTLLLSLIQKGKQNFWLGGLLGVVVLWLLALIPAIGGLFCFLSAIFGFGILLHGLHHIFFKRTA